MAQTSLTSTSLDGKHLDALIPDVAWESLFQRHNSLFVVPVWRRSRTCLLKPAFWRPSWSVLLTPFKQRIFHCPACQRSDMLKLTQLDLLSHLIHSLHPNWTAVLYHVNSRREKGNFVGNMLTKSGCTCDSTTRCALTNVPHFVALACTYTDHHHQNSTVFFLEQCGTCFKTRNICPIYPNWSMRQSRWREWNQILWTE